eukprot:406438-Pleurochrysis_carterae.AAC.1
MSQIDATQDLRSVSTDDVNVKDWKELYSHMEEWQRELVARKWLKAKGYWWCSVVSLQNTYWAHFLAICRQPPGRTDDSRDLQQCCFKMELWDDRVEHMLNLRYHGFTCMRHKRYSVGESGRVEW